jgi:hypothetical protein
MLDYYLILFSKVGARAILGIITYLDLHEFGVHHTLLQMKFVHMLAASSLS